MNSIICFLAVFNLLPVLVGTWLNPWLKPDSVSVHFGECLVWKGCFRLSHSIWVETRSGLLTWSLQNEEFLLFESFWSPVFWIIIMLPDASNISAFFSLFFEDHSVSLCPGLCLTVNSVEFLSFVNHWSVSKFILAVCGVA